MEYRHLRFFLAVADELHFTRAAARLGVAQPYVSAEIQRLEDELGVELFTRSKRHVEITPAGEAFRRRALEILDLTERARGDARRAARGEIGQLVIGFAGSAGYDVLPTALRRFRARWPEVDVVLRELTTVEQLRALRDERIDVGLGRPRGDPGAGLETRVVREERGVVALPAGHRLEGASDIELGELASEAWIAFDQTAGPGLHQLLVAACEDAGFTPRVAQVAGEIPTMVNLVASGMGIALLPESVASLSREGVVFRPLAGQAPLIQLGVLWRTGPQAPVLTRFIETLFEVEAD